jgi:hypothetical protein
MKNHAFTLGLLMDEWKNHATLNLSMDE